MAVAAAAASPWEVDDCLLGADVVSRVIIIIIIIVSSLVVDIVVVRSSSGIVTASVIVNTNSTICAAHVHSVRVT